MYRVLTSHASSTIYPDLFEPGRYTFEEATLHAAHLEKHGAGTLAWVVPDGANARDVLHDKGWI